MPRNFKTMPKGLIIVPMPNNPSRFCIWDPTADVFIKNGVNINRVKAEMTGASAHPQNWEVVARQHGWIPPGEVKPDSDAEPDTEPDTEPNAKTSKEDSAETVTPQDPAKLLDDTDAKPTVHPSKEQGLD